LRTFVEKHDRVYVVEQNRDAQMKELISLAIPDLCTKLRSVLHYNGLPLDARSVTESVFAQESR
jgi:2-oxoglutarate/2-oxoacid ferredoxin oxidoreductase subunit alpha